MRFIETEINLKKEQINYSRFRKNYKHFKLALLASQKVVYADSKFENITFGNPLAHTKLLVISSPFCIFCKDVHYLIKDILAKYEEDIFIRLHFNANISKDSAESNLIHRNLVNKYLQDKDNFLSALNYNIDELKDIGKEYSIVSPLTNKFIDEILNEQFIWNNLNNINYTPAIYINSFFYPEKYYLADLEYFIKELISDISV